MKTNKFSRVIALLLTLVMLLGTMPASLAEGSAIVENAKYQAALDAVVQMYHDELAACTTYEEAKILYGNRDWNHFEEFINRLPEADRTALDTSLYALYEDYVTRTDVLWPIPVVDFTGVAGFMPPVSGTTTYNLRTASIVPLEDDTTSNLDPDKNGVVLDKYISSADAANGEYTLTLEAYTTGAKTLVETQVEKPVDIILVLDQSGSMKYCINCGATSFTEGQPCDEDEVEYVYTPVYDIVNSQNSEYYYMADGGYEQAYYCRGYDSNYGTWDDCDAGWYTTEHYGWNNNHNPAWYDESLTPKTSAEDTEGVQFYTRTVVTTGTTHQSRRNALKDSVEEFVASVAEKAAGTDGDITTTLDNVNHRIAVVGFGTQNDDGYNTEILSVAGNNSSYGSGSVGVRYNRLNDTHYASALQSMDTTAGVTMVNNAVDALAQSGATRSDLGMTMATNILKNNRPAAGEQRSQIVIMFTDGTPTSSNSFDETVAEGAIAQANTQKNTYGATVYTIGVFDGADASNPTVLPPYNTTGSNRENRYMHLVSSNYLKATGIDNNETGTINPNVSNSKSYYLSASNTTALNTIFEKIAGDVDEAGGSSTKLTEETVVKDIVAGEFVLPNGAAASQIKVYTSDYVAENTFGKKNEDDTITVGTREEYNAEIVVNGSSISVSNFNFSENWVGTEKKTDVNGVETITYRGKKLIIEVPIVVREDFLGGYQVETNGKVSGIFENASATERLEEFVSPKVNVPLKTITPVINDQHVYLSNYADLLEMITHYTTSDGETTAFHQYTYEVNGTKKTATIDGINNSHVDITYTFADMAGNVVATYTVEKGKTTGTFTVVDANKVLLTDSKQYQISCTVTPNPAGTLEATTGKATGWVHIYKPVLTFEDTEEEYLTSDHSTDYYNVNNFKPSATQWKREDGTLSTATGVSMRGTVPGITLTYDKAVEGVLLTGTQVTAKADVHVNVTEVQLAGDNPGDYASNTTVVRLVCDCDHKDPANCQHTAALTAELKDGGNNPEFIVHVYNVYGHLTVTKTVVTPSGVTPAYDEFTFTLTLTDKDNAALEGDFNYTIKSGETTVSTGKIGNSGTFKLKHGQTITIAELPPETKYTVTENVPTGYAANPITSTGSITAGQTANVGVENTYSVGSLKIEKDVAGSAAPDDAEFTFTVNLKAQDGSALAGSYSYTGSKSGTISNGGTITLKDGEYITIANLPVDATYTVTETSNEDYITDPSDYKRTGTISTTLSEAKFTNTYQKQNLTITKVVKDSTFTTGSRTFTFEVIDAKGKKHPVSISVDAANKADKTKNTETILVPVGSTTVTETTTEGYATTMNGATGTSTVVEINENASATVDVVNTANSKYDSIPVTKNWVDNNNALGERPTGIVVKLKATYDGKTVAVEPTWTLTDTSATDETWTGSWTNVDMFDSNGNKIAYTVEEEAVNKYTTDTITGNPDDGYQINNRINVGDLAVKKTVVDNEANANPNSNEQFEYTLTLTDTTSSFNYTIKNSETTVSSGEIGNGGKFYLKNGETITVENLTPGTGYTVTETDPIGFVVTPASRVLEGSITSGATAQNEFINSYDVADLTITKRIVDANGNDVTDANVNDDEFTFSVEIGDAAYDGAYYIDDTEYMAVGGVITIAGAKTATIKNIPIKTEYAVEEDEDSLPTGYTVVMPNGENGLLVSDKTVTITNTYTTGSLKIEKDVTGSAAPADAEFTFTVNLKAKDGSALTGSYSYTGSKSGKISNGGTITLKDSEYITIANLPVDATYTVTETSNADYITDPSDYKRTGTISTTLSEAQFTNTYKFQNLTITKVVKDSTFETGTREFRFDVAKSDGDTEVVSIQVDASTKTNSVTVLVPVGNTTVTEQAASAVDYAVTYTYGNATRENAPELPISYEGEWSITVTNTAHKDYENVNVTKTWVDNDNLLGERPSSITVNLVGTVNGASFDHGKDELTTSWIDQKDNTWKAGWTAVPMFDADGNKIEYSVTENPVEKYTMTGITGNAESGFAITNAINVGDLSIAKTVEDEENDGVDPTDLDFTFRVTLKDAEDNALSGISYTGDKTGTVSDGDTITLKAGQTVTLENLPEGSTYAVEEINIPVGYTLKTQTGIVGTIAAGTTAAAAFTNTFEVADLVITKKIVDETGRDFAGTTKDDDVFTINVTLPAGTYTMSNGEPFVSTGAAQAITITGANSVTFQNIPINTAYTVAEDTTKLQTGYELKSTVDSDAGMLSDDGATVTITNTYLNGELAITKDVVNDTGIDQNAAEEFTFTVELPAGKTFPIEGISGQTSLTVGADGKATITLTDAQTVTIKDIPPETKYTVTETVPTGYVSETTATEYNSTEGEIDAGLTDAITVTNTFKVADLTVTKVITGGDENTSDDIFTFEIELPEGTYVIEDAKTIGADGTVADLTTLTVGNDKKAMFVLVGPSTATIKNIPINTAYSIVETSLPTGYTFGSVTGEATATITANENKIADAINADENAVTFTNAYAKGGLTIEKVVVGTDAPKDTDMFTFTVDITDAAGNAIAGTYAYTIGTVSGSIKTGTANEAERQITLKHGEKAIFETLPTGAVVTVTETENADYVTTPGLEQTSTITAVTSELKFTNTYQYGSLTISKSGIDTTLDPNAKTVYRVTGKGVDLTVVVDGNGSVKINRLPLGDYTVTELTDWSWRYEATTANPQTDTIKATENAAVAFGNKRDKTQWLDGETSAENKFDPVTEQQEVSENE